MGYSTGYFSEFGPFLKMIITRKFELGISSNFLYSIRMLICIRKYNKNFGCFWSHFLEKSMGYSTLNTIVGGVASLVICLLVKLQHWRDKRIKKASDSSVCNNNCNNNY